jgi:hypothetical protein
VAQREDLGQSGSLGDELAEAIRRQVDQVAEALREEVERLQQEMSERGRAAARGAGYVGAAGALGLVAGGALASLPLIALRKVLPPAAVALLVAGGATAGAIVLVRRGLEQLKVAAPDALEQRIDEAGDEIAETLRAQARQHGAP